MKKYCFIYSISEPINGKVIYVGRTTNIEQRFYAHLHCETTYIGKAIKDILKQGLNPIFKVIEKTNNINSFLREAYWIYKMEKNGCELFNAPCLKKRIKLNLC